ncbi:MAG TPA: histidine kinase [Trebonia sp.]|nr:histidine kinase [Trebonia sp.]
MSGGSGARWPGMTLRGNGNGNGNGEAWQPTWRVMLSGVWLVYLIQPTVTLFQHHFGTAKIALGIAILAVFCVTYCGMFLTWTHPLRRVAWVLPLLFVLASLGSLLFDDISKWNLLWVYVSVACGLMLRSYRAATLAVLASATSFLVCSVIARDSTTDYLVSLLPVILVGFVMIGGRKQHELVQELRQARETVARMAASQERLRLARDMHDLTGQSLSTITLKSELTARLLGRLPEGAERDRVRDEVEQIAAVSRQTLRDIREAISGYRRPTLAVEIITARNVLESAGITAHDDPELTLLSGSFDPDAEAALAWCLREAVTNVVRHSGARNCDIRLIRHARTLALEVTDDGRALAAPPSLEPSLEPSAEPSPQPLGPSPEWSLGPLAGTGLRGMSERLSAVGGRLELRPAADGFRLVATVPARRPLAAPSATVTA